MSSEVEVIDVNATSNHAAMHSVMVMEQWGNGETYNEATWIERGRHAVRQTLEGMFELGRALIVLKEHTEHGRFESIVKEQFGLGKAETSRLMNATKRFATPQMQKAAPKLMDLGKSKLLELLVEEDVTLVGLAEGEEVNRKYDVRNVPFVLVGEKITVAKNPWKQFSAQVQRWDENGKETWLEVPELVVNEFGFREDAAVIGQEYKAHADTPAQTNTKELDKLAMGADTLEQAEHNCKAKALPFGGRIDPFAHQEQVLADDKVRYMPKRGQQMDYNKMDVQAAVLNEFELRKIMKQRVDEMGFDWATALQRLKDEYPNGAPESELETVFAHITRPKLNLISRTGTDG